MGDCTPTEKIKRNPPRHQGSRKAELFGKRSNRGAGVSFCAKHKIQTSEAHCDDGGGHLNLVIFTSLGSYISSLVPGGTMGSFSVFMTMLLGIKFIFKPVMTTKEAMLKIDKKTQIIRSILCGILIGFVCGFVGAGGGMMMLLVLTSVLGYELKTAVGTSVFVMTFTALTGALSHFAISGTPDIFCLAACILSTLLWARIAAKIANKSDTKVLNRTVGIVLLIIGVCVLGVELF